jgi:probable HAF family extracellular repeat protein
MKSNPLTCITATALFTALAMPGQLVAQPTRYKLIDLGSLTGLAVPGRPLNSRGTLAFGACGNPDCSVFHTFTWRNDAITDLGSGLSGGGPIWISDSGLVLSNAANGLIDPMSGMPEQRGVLFLKGNGIDIGTLDGGNESFGLAVNDSGSVVGVASNSVPDPFSLFGFATQTRAVLWQKGILSDLGTLGGPDAIAANVNERGQVAGLSYTDATPNPTTGKPTVHPFLWDLGKIIDLGTLGGVFRVAGSFSGEAGLVHNNRGQVAGTSGLPGDQVWHPFLWERGVLRDLGTLGGSTGESTCINVPGKLSAKQISR